MKRVTKILILLLAVVAIVSCQKEQTYGGGGVNWPEFESHSFRVPKEGKTFKVKLLTKFDKLDPTHVDYQALLLIPAFWYVDYVEVIKVDTEASTANVFLGRHFNKGHIIPPMSSLPNARGASYGYKNFDCPFLITNQIYSSETEDGSEYIEVTIKPNPYDDHLVMTILLGLNSHMTFSQSGK